MDVDEAGEGSWFQYSIGYTSAVRVGLLEEIKKTADYVNRSYCLFLSELISFPLLD